MYIFFIPETIKSLRKYFAKSSLNSLFFFKDFLFWKNFKKSPTDSVIYKRLLEFNTLVNNLLPRKLKYILYKPNSLVYLYWLINRKNLKKFLKQSWW